MPELFLPERSALDVKPGIPPARIHLCSPSVSTTASRASLLHCLEAREEGKSEKGELGQPAHMAHILVPFLRNTFPSCCLLTSELILHLSSSFESQKQELDSQRGALGPGRCAGPRSKVWPPSPAGPSAFTSARLSTIQSHLSEDLEA